MSKRVFVLMLAVATALLAIALLAQGCAPRRFTKVADRTEKRVDALDRYSILEFKLRRIRYSLALIDDEVEAMREPGGDTTMVNPQAIETVSLEMGGVCEELEKTIKEVEIEIARLRAELDELRDGGVALGRVAGLADILQSIDDEVESVKESGGDADMELTTCDNALIELERLQGVLTMLAEEVRKLQSGPRGY